MRVMLTSKANTCQTYHIAGVTPRWNDHSSQPSQENPSKNSATGFYFSGTFLDLTNNASLQAAIFTHNNVFPFSCSVKKQNEKKKNNKHFPSRRSAVCVWIKGCNGRVRTRLFVSICVTGMKTVVTSIPKLTDDRNPKVLLQMLV